MDSTIYTNSGAPLITPWSARGMSNDKFALLQVKAEKKQAIESGAMKAFEAPKMKAAEKSKQQVREKIEQIKKRLNILRKLYSGNPKEMAKALAGVFKELKAALKDYKAAIKDEIGGSVSAVESVMETPAAGAIPGSDKDGKDTKDAEPKADDVAAPADAATAEADAAKPEPDGTAKADGETPGPVAAQPETAADPAAKAPAEDKTSLYGAIEQKVREIAGKDGQDFVKEIKGLVQWIEDRMLSPARGQMKAKKPDKETDKAFDEVDKELKDLKKDMDDMERDIKREVPTLGMHLDIAA